MNVFSFSRLNLYATCPYRFYKRYVEEYVEPLTYPLALGTAVHKAIEDKMNGVHHDQALMNGMIEAEFHPEVTKRELSYLVNKAPLDRVNGQTEFYFKLPLSQEFNSPMIRGYIDVVGNGYIVDWKTNRRYYNLLENHQISLYSWAISRMKNLSKVYGSLFFLRFSQPSTYWFTQKEMEQSRRWAYDTAREIQEKLVLVKQSPNRIEELFPATPSSFCSHCPFSVECVRKFSPLYMGGV